MRTLVVALSTLAVASARIKCGETPCFQPVLSHPNIEIVGGKPASPYSWPWQVSLCIIQSWEEKICDHYCGGSIIGKNWVMTAAHCINRGKDDYGIKAGVFDVLRSHAQLTKIVRAENIFVHPQYNSTTDKNDIALIQLAESLSAETNVAINSVCLPKNDTVARRGNNLWVTGWGSTREGSIGSRELRQAYVPVVNITACQSMYPGKLFPKAEFCAGKEGVDSCQGDSGGPAVAQGDYFEPWYQYGVVSWGDGCARKDKPGVYTRVSNYCEWIKKKTKSEVVCK